MKTIPTYLKAFLFGIITVTAFYITGCSNSADVASTNTTAQSDALLTIANPSATASAMTDATLQNDAVLMPPGSDFARLPFTIIGCLQLTADQLTSVQGFIKSFDNATKVVRDSLRNSEKAIIDQSKASVKAILDSVKAGTLDKATAATELKAINAATRDALKNNPVRTWADAQLKANQATLYASIRGILTADQQVIWDNWVATGADCHRQFHGIDTLRQHQMDSVRHTMDSLRHYLDSLHGHRP